MRDKSAVDAYNHAIAQIDRSTDGETIRLAELAALVQFGLGHSLDQPTFENLAQAQGELHNIENDLNARLDAGEITFKEHQQYVNEALRVMLDRFRSILGEMQYQKMFYDMPDDEILNK